MDLLELLTERGIDAATSGGNVKKGCVGIACPFCGDDPSQHMMIDAQRGNWWCWRNPNHSGRDLAYLLARLFGISYEAAYGLIKPSRELLGAWNQNRSASPLEPAPQRGNGSSTPFQAAGLRRLYLSSRNSRFWGYLMDRGFTKNWKDLADRYNLHCALTGDFRNRIVWPVNAGHTIIGYTGRCIDGGHLRYLSLPGDEVKKHLLWENTLAFGGRRLFIVEGPMDAMKLDWTFYCEDIRDRATCLFGVNQTAEQLTAIRRLAPGYKQVLIMFDPGAVSTALNLKRALSDLHPRVVQVPETAEDPGDMTREEILQLLKGL
jgi:hypothetical protein